MLIPTSFAFDSHVIDDVDAFAQYLDITQISSEKYVPTIDDKTMIFIMGIKVHNTNL
jgi:hypothetical protein